MYYHQNYQIPIGLGARSIQKCFFLPVGNSTTLATVQFFFQWSLVLTDVKICNICTKWYALIQDEFHNLLMGEEWLIVSLCFRMCIMLKCPMHSISDRLKSVEFFILCLLHDTYYTSSLHCYIWTLRYASFLCIIRLLWKHMTFSYMDGISLCAATHPLRRPFTDSLYEWNNHSVHRTIAE